MPNHFRRADAAMIILPASHLDHGLTPSHIRWMLEVFAHRDAFFKETIALPILLEPLACGLYGPIMHDLPIRERECTYRQRGERTWLSRTIRRPVRMVRKLTVIAGPYDGNACVLFTAYGGPEAPREPNDPAIDDDEDAQREARAFWAHHALSATVSS